MANQIPAQILAPWAHMLAGAGRKLLLVPEAVAIIGLTGVALMGKGGTAAGLAIAGLTCYFVIRVAAMYLAQAALASARYREAASLAGLAHAMHPWSADALALRGVIALTTGSVGAAIEMLRAAIQLAPDHGAAYTTLSGALLAIGRISAARIAAQQAIALNPNNAIAHLYLAESELSGGASPLIVEDIMRHGLTLAQRPDDQAAFRCALAALLLDQGRSAESALALSGIERILDACVPTSRNRLRLRYGELLMAQGQVERAREYLQGTILVERMSV
jgi:tetratricopeptide (TPR) repeat protein